MNIFKHFRDVDLCRIRINKDKFKESVKGSCVIQTHPVLKEKLSEDKQLRIKELLEELCDLLRDEIGDVEEL